MPTLELADLSDDEAEAVVAAVWRKLEEFCIPTPKLRIEARSNGHLNISLAFDKQKDAERVSMALMGASGIARYATAED